MADYEAVIGLEIHVQLKTKSKMFCRCSNDSEGAKPNQHTCPVCLGMPGTLPVPNRTAVEWAVKVSSALGCSIEAVSKFDRKQYFYPDLPKGYQISQYDEPIGGPGKFEFDLVEPDGSINSRTIGITRLHLEEDAGKLTHPKGATYSLVDLNRAGTPLMEIVTEPDLRSPAEAKTFLQELRLVMRYLGVSDADMEKGHLRADANVSVRPKGQKELGIKTELKNLNSFKFVEKGLQSEIERQTKMLEQGEKVTQETRGFIEATGKTVSQRSKEEAQDYRYFPEPDIPPLDVAGLKPEKLAKGIPELPVPRRRRWRKQLPEEVVGVAASSLAEADVLDQVIQSDPDPGSLGKRWLNARGELTDPTALATFIPATGQLVKDGKLEVGQVKVLAAKVSQTGKPPDQVVASDPAFQTVDTGQLDNLVDQAIKDNPKAIEDFKGGNPNAVNVIVGAVMKISKGSANPTTVKALVTEKLEHL